MKIRCLPAAVALAMLAVPSATAPAKPTTLPVVDPTIAAARDTEPVILKGASFPGWAVPANQTVKLPFMDLAGTEACQATIDPTKADPGQLANGLGSFDPTEGGIGIPDPSGPSAGVISYDPDQCPPQHYADPEVDTARLTAGTLEGTPTDRLLGYAWDAKAKRFRQIPFQVDEMFTRYLDNSRSGFALYSGQDQHTTYAFDREGFRWTETDPKDPCRAAPNSAVAKDPVVGLDTNDELSFMAEDAAGQAPSSAPLPKGIDSAREVRVVDPLDKAHVTYAYVMRATADGPRPAYDASNGYVRYQRDADADRFAYSQSSYGSYGNAPKGPVCDASGHYVVDPATGKPAQVQRRPLDGATVTTKGYRFRYDGRWLMTGIEISKDNGRTYGPDLVDRWKARAFAQDPGSNTPCCGYEEEDSNWGGSGITLGERVGPVRAIRETWGADSGTNVVRRETFYKHELRQKTYLRVHVIPPLDGIYSQWDFNAGTVDTFFNPFTATQSNPTTHGKGVPIDGRNDEAFGNLDDPCNDRWDANDTDAFSKGYRQAYKMLAGGGYSFCKDFPYHQSVDTSDPSFSGANAALSWAMVTGDNGTIVDRTTADPADISPGGTAQSLLAVPYYRDDACFDDGTGSDPGLELYPRHDDLEIDPRTWARDPRMAGITARKCWKGDPKVPGGDPRFWQGSIATHGLHILFVADSDNARQTIPTDEIVAETRMVMLPQRLDGDGGEQYGRSFEKPLLPLVLPFGSGNGTESGPPPGDATGQPGGDASAGGSAGSAGSAGSTGAGGSAGHADAPATSGSGHGGSAPQTTAQRKRAADKRAAERKRAANRRAAARKRAANRRAAARKRAANRRAAARKRAAHRRARRR